MRDVPFPKQPQCFFQLEIQNQRWWQPKKEWWDRGTVPICCITGNGHLSQKGKPIELHQNQMAEVKTAAWPWRDDNYIKNNNLKRPACLHEMIFHLLSKPRIRGARTIPLSVFVFLCRCKHSHVGLEEILSLPVEPSTCTYLLREEHQTQSYWLIINDRPVIDN